MSMRAGSGKTAVEEAWASEVVRVEGDAAELLWLAPYNSQVDSLKARVGPKAHLWRALKSGRRLMTVAAPIPTRWYAR